MTKEERLKIYKKCLKDYKRATKWYRFLFETNTKFGICFNLFINNAFSSSEKMESYPELLKQKPENCYDYDYWFKRGELQPRIECLERAIKLCEND